MNQQEDLPNWYKFKVVAYLRSGVLDIQAIKPQSSEGNVMLFNLRVDEVPLNIVPVTHRLPNSIIWCFVEENRTISKVSVTEPSQI